jgi:hypothetical protein
MSGAFLWVEWTTQNQVERAWERSQGFGGGERDGDEVADGVEEDEGSAGIVLRAFRFEIDQEAGLIINLYSYSEK